MKEELDKILEGVNNWLKYAEAKNATLLAANGLMIFGIVRILVAWDIESISINLYLIFVVILLVISTTALLISFIPYLDIPWLFKLQKPDKEKDNLLYFEHISKYTPRVYLDSLSAAIASQNHHGERYEFMQANQIIANSVIARRKFIIFTIAIWITIGAVITPLFAWMIKENYIEFKRKDRK